MAHKLMSKIDSRLKFLHRKNKYLTPKTVIVFYFNLIFG